MPTPAEDPRWSIEGSDRLSDEAIDAWADLLLSMAEADLRKEEEEKVASTR